VIQNLLQGIHYGLLRIKAEVVRFVKPHGKANLKRGGWMGGSVEHKKQFFPDY